MLNQGLLRNWLPQLHLSVKSGPVKCTACASGSGFLDRLRRGRESGIQLHAAWCCSPECFENAVRRECNQLLRRQELPGWSHSHRMPLGLLLLSQGVIDRAQLEFALAAQRGAGHGRIGEWLQKLGYASECEITKALSLQWGCPMLRAAGLHPSPEHRIPSLLLDFYGVIPVHYFAATRKLYVAFSYGIDRSLLYATGQMLECDTEACVIGESLMSRELEIGRRSSGDEVVIEAKHGATEMARTCCSYALELRASQMRLVRCGPFIWTRFSHASGLFDLMFRTIQTNQT